jgi:hypothetical protein
MKLVGRMWLRRRFLLWLSDLLAGGIDLLDDLMT